MSRWTSKTPVEIVDLAIDFTQVLASLIPNTQTISNPIATVTSENETVPTLEISNVQVSLKDVLMRATGGTHGKQYKVTITVDTSSGQIIQEFGTLPVVN